MEISAKTSKTLEKVKIPQLDNFIRFDILGHKTVKQAQKLKSKKTGTLKRLQSIKDIMDEKENELKIGWCGIIHRKEWTKKRVHLKRDIVLWINQ